MIEENGNNHNGIGENEKNNRKFLVKPPFSFTLHLHNHNPPPLHPLMLWAVSAKLFMKETRESM